MIAEWLPAFALVCAGHMAETADNATKPLRSVEPKAFQNVIIKVDTFHKLWCRTDWNNCSNPSPIKQITANRIAFLEASSFAGTNIFLIEREGMRMEYFRASGAHAELMQGRCEVQAFEGFAG